MKTVKTYLGIGSNLGKRGENIRDAMLNLERWGVKILRSSSLYETEPVGLEDQPWFYNMVVLAETGMSPEELLKVISAIEMAMGRERTAADDKSVTGGTEPGEVRRGRVYGSRPIDIDILFYGDEVVEIPGLTIPHPRIAERNFVLVPLAEIAAGFVHPVLKKSVGELLKGCGDNAIVKPIS